jgi:pimeloyl-ACP methyl ester carboxylesterase
VGVDARTTRVQSGEVTLNVTDAGEGPPVLLLHGFPDSLHMWDGVVPHLVAAGYRVVAYDQRGFGESSAPAGRRHYAIDAIVQDALEVIAACELGGPLTVVGHDWGAAISWCLASWHPELVARHVAISVGHPVAFRHGGIAQKLRSWYIVFFQLVGLSEWVLSRRNFAFMRWFLDSHPEPERFLRDVSRHGRLTAGLNWYRRNTMLSDTLDGDGGRVQRHAW